MQYQRIASVLIAMSLWLLTGVGMAVERGQGVEAVLGKEVSVPKYHALVIGINDYKRQTHLKFFRFKSKAVL
jgi:hypothetical protein